MDKYQEVLEALTELSIYELLVIKNTSIGQLINRKRKEDINNEKSFSNKEKTNQENDKLFKSIDRK